MKSTLKILAVLALAAATANADWSNRQLPSDATAIMKGTSTFSGLSTTGYLDIDVDYAVYAPGTFTGTFNPFPTFSPLSATDYVYAYQIYNKGPGQSGLGTTDLSTLNVNFGAISSLGSDAAFDPSSDDVAATTAFYFAPTASYLFLFPSLGLDKFSVVLLLSSPNAPVFQPSNVIDGGLAINGSLPAPVPSPAAAVLGLIGLATIGFSRRGTR